MIINYYMKGKIEANYLQLIDYKCHYITIQIKNPASLPGMG